MKLRRAHDKAIGVCFLPAQCCDHAGVVGGRAKAPLSNSGTMSADSHAASSP